MGEYWKPINITRREYLHPHNLDCGLKWREWNWEQSDSPVQAAVRALIAADRWSVTDDIRVVSDYGKQEEMVLLNHAECTCSVIGIRSAAPLPYAVDEDGQVMADLYGIAIHSFRDISEEAARIAGVKFTPPRLPEIDAECAHLFKHFKAHR